MKYTLRHTSRLTGPLASATQYYAWHKAHSVTLFSCIQQIILNFQIRSAIFDSFHDKDSLEQQPINSVFPEQRY